MKQVLLLESNKYEIKLDNFEGPLDLLCYLVDKNKLNISEIKISDIADQYIEYIQRSEKLDMEIASEFLIMASTLIYLKSKMLLPREEEEDEEPTEEELLQRIIEYKKFKEISIVLKEQYAENRKRFYKLPDKVELKKQKLERDYNSELIPNLYSELMTRVKERRNVNIENINKIAVMETVTVASKVKEIFKELTKKPKFIFNKLFSLKKCSNLEVVTAFTGVLELTRRNKVNTKQEELFGDIIVEKIQK